MTAAEPIDSPPRGPRFGACVAAVLVSCGSAAAPPAADPDGDGRWVDNVVVVTLDTTRADHVSPTGGDPRITPVLSAFAERASVFTRARSEANITNPSHLTIFSGLPVVDHGVETNSQAVPADVDTLSEACQRAGLRTVGLPSIHHVSVLLAWRGFDRLAPPARDADEVTERAVAWLRRVQAGERFFLWVHYFDPHAPYEPPPELAAEFYAGDPTAGDAVPLAEREALGGRSPAFLREWLAGVRDEAWPRAMYAAEIHHTDRALGRLLAALDETGLAQRTAVVVVADHGESLGEHGVYYDHRHLYETQLRVPLLIRVPGWPAARFDEPVTTLDLAPTLCELLGVELHNALPGTSLVGALRGLERPRASDADTFVHQGANGKDVAVRRGAWKLLWTLRGRDAGTALFDLERDPGETNDVADEHPDVVAELRAIAEAHLGRATHAPATTLSDEEAQALEALGYGD